jgi:hypothetical protein
MPNPFAKTRKLHEPYAIFINNQGWEWRILKTYKQPSSEAKDKFARWYVAATSPHMGDGQLGVWRHLRYRNQELRSAC